MIDNMLLELLHNGHSNLYWDYGEEDDIYKITVLFYSKTSKTSKNFFTTKLNKKKLTALCTDIRQI